MDVTQAMMEFAYMKGKMEWLDEKVDALSKRQDEMDAKLDQLIETASLTRMFVLGIKGLFAGAFALIGLNLDNIVTGVRLLFK